MGKNVFVSSRRDFLRILPGGAAACLGCASALGVPLAGESQATAQHKFQQDSGMTNQEVLEFALMGSIPLLQNMAGVIGREKFLTSLQKASDKFYRQWAEELFKGIEERNLANLKAVTTELLSKPPYVNYVSFRITEDTGSVFEATYSECLFAEVLREMQAEDIGYVTQCSGGHQIAAVYNTKLKYSQPKNFMKGDEVCIERYVMS